MKEPLPLIEAQERVQRVVTALIEVLVRECKSKLLAGLPLSGTNIDLTTAALASACLFRTVIEDVRQQLPSQAFEELWGLVETMLTGEAPERDPYEPKPPAEQPS